MIEIQNLSFSYGDKDIFTNAELKLFTLEKVGLIGANGSGKSTLMKLLSQKQSPDKGKIIWGNNLSFSYLDQYFNLCDNLSISEYLYGTYDELYKKEASLNKLYEELSVTVEANYDRILNRAERIQNELEEQGFYMIKSKIGNIINGLGIPIEDNHLIGKLSGGQRMKVFLGKMLLEEKDVLLLDEPTNFLDSTHVDWLTKYLLNYKNPYIVISHNTEFLNSISNVIVSIENNKLLKYKGNYIDFIAQSEQRKESYEKEYKKQQSYIKRTEDFIKKNIVRASTAKRAKSREKALDKLEVLAQPQNERKIKFNFPFTKSFNKASVEVKNLSIGYKYALLEEINLRFEFGEKVVILGENGLGKTTFIKSLLGIIPSLRGTVKLAPYNDIVYFSQDYKVEDINSLEYFRQDYPLMNDQDIYNHLATYSIKRSLALKSMKLLSGGELTKLRFAKLNLESSNLLILDEPTNHLDKNAKSALFNALSLYPGTLILVSHEKHFYKKLNMKEIVFKKLSQL